MPSFSPETQRTLWISVGVSMLLTGIPMAFNPGEIAVLTGVCFLTFGAVGIFRGAHPQLFTKVIPEQKIAGIPAKHHESWRVWVCILITISGLSVMADRVYKKHAPKQVAAQLNLAGMLNKGFQELGDQIANTKAVSAPPIRQAQRIPESKPIDPDLKLLSDSERLCIALEGWHTAQIMQRRAREEEMQKEIAARHLDQQGAAAQMAWVDGSWWDEVLPDYQRTFVPQLLELRRQMLAVAPDGAADGSMGDWANPGNSGGITGVENQFAGQVKAYRNRLQKVGKVAFDLTPEEKEMDRNGLQFIFNR